MNRCSCTVYSSLYQKTRLYQKKRVFSFIIQKKRLPCGTLYSLLLSHDSRRYMYAVQELDEGVHRKLLLPARRSYPRRGRAWGRNHFLVLVERFFDVERFFASSMFFLAIFFRSFDLFGKGIEDWFCGPSGRIPSRCWCAAGIGTTWRKSSGHAAARWCEAPTGPVPHGQLPL